MKKFVIQSVLLLGVIIIAVFLFQSNARVPELPFLPRPSVLWEVEINGALLKVEIADTQDKRSKGLGGKQPLASDEGMLFIFPKADKHPFWMKGLSFPLDFVWIRENKVVDVLQNIPPPQPEQTDESLPIYSSNEPADKVLEVLAGTAKRLNIKAGDLVKIEF